VYTCGTSLSAVDLRLKRNFYIHSRTRQTAIVAVVCFPLPPLGLQLEGI
jgi:hypothetical protein